MIWIEQIRSLPGSCKIDSSVKAWFDVLCIETNIHIYIYICIYIIYIYIISLSHIWVTLWNEMCSVHVWVGTKLLLANHPESSLPPLPSFWPRICVSIYHLAIIQHARCYWPAQEIATPQKFLTLHAIPKPLLHDLLWTVEEKAALHIYLPHQAQDGFDGSEILLTSWDRNETPRAKMEDSEFYQLINKISSINSMEFDQGFQSCLCQEVFWKIVRKHKIRGFEGRALNMSPPDKPTNQSSCGICETHAKDRQRKRGKVPSQQWKRKSENEWYRFQISLALTRLKNREPAWGSNINVCSFISLSLPFWAKNKRLQCYNVESLESIGLPSCLVTSLLSTSHEAFVPKTSFHPRRFSALLHNQSTFSAGFVGHWCWNVLGVSTGQLPRCSEHY